MLRAVLGLCPLLVAAPLLAAEPAPAPGPPSGPVSAEAPALEAALDALIPGRLEALGVPGVAVAVVRRDGVVLTRGWGVREAGTDEPVGADTLFRVGSLSKPVTATAAVELAARGELDPHRDLAAYLGDADPERSYPGEVTLHHLLTHTAGFDQSDIGDATPRAEDVIPLARWVRERPQPQVMPPGFAHHYSNFGYALAGRVVETVAGAPFEEHVERRIFEPLGMRSSSFRQPPPPALAERLATGHEVEGRPTPLPLDFSHTAPADALVTTAADMANFLRLHLGAFPEVLAPGPLAEMHRTQFTTTPTPLGMAYGFEENHLGRRVLEHGGSQLGFTSLLMLVPDHDLGLFIAQNGRGEDLRWEIVRTVFEELVQDPWLGERDPAPARPLPEIDPALYAGAYRPTGYTHHTFEKVAWMLGFRGGQTHVEAGDEPGTLRIEGEPWFVAPEAGPHRFRHERAAWYVKGFVVDEGGRASHLVAGREVLERTPWWERTPTLRAVLMAATLLALWGAVAWPVAIAVARRRAAGGPERSEVSGTSGSSGLSGSGARWGRRTVHLASALWLVTTVGFFAAMPVLVGGPVQFDYGLGWEIYTLLTLWNLAAAGGVAIVLVAALAWARGWWRPAARWTVSLQAVAMAAAIAALVYMNLLGYRV